MKGADRRRRRLLQGALAAAALPAAQPAAPQSSAVPERKVLRVLFNKAETTFDPARISDN